MDEKVGDIPGGDVHVKNGTIVAVGNGLSLPPGAEVIDARAMMVLPGLVETHWHLWTLADSGIRARFGYGYPQGLARDQAVDLADSRRVQRQWFSNPNDNLLTLGYVARGARYPGAYPGESRQKDGYSDFGPHQHHPALRQRDGNRDVL